VVREHIDRLAAGDDRGDQGLAAIGGFALGVVLDLTVLRKRLDSGFDLGLTALSVIALFYSIMIFGFFMGFPLFLLLVGLGGGHVVGRSAAIHRLTAEWVARERRLVAAAATSMLAAQYGATILEARRASRIASA
jgi:hypothetical protein